MADVTLVNVSKVYPGGAAVVKNVSIDIRDREFVVLVGPSGCGKSTTLRMIAGLEEISTGDLLIDHERVNDRSPKDRDIAMVFQNYALYPHMTVFENLAFGLKLRRLPPADIRARVAEAARMLDIEAYLQRLPKALSGGQRQRVALGRALVRKPKVFLFDEPLSNLDAKLRTQMRTEISKLHKQLEATMIYVTHDQTEAMTMGDRIVVMKGGEVRQIDTPLAIYQKPANRFVAGFIGSPSMNVVPGRLLDGGAWRFQSEDGSFELPLDPAAHALAGRDGAEVVLGIRAEDVSERPPEGRPFREIRSTLEVLEPLGHEMYLHGPLAGVQIVARVPATQRYRVGDPLTLFLDPARVHLFDRNTEERI